MFIFRLSSPMALQTVKAVMEYNINSMVIHKTRLLLSNVIKTGCVVTLRVKSLLRPSRRFDLKQLSTCCNPIGRPVGERESGNNSRGAADEQTARMVRRTEEGTPTALRRRKGRRKKT